MIPGGWFIFLGTWHWREHGLKEAHCAHIQPSGQCMPFYPAGTKIEDLCPTCRAAFIGAYRKTAPRVEAYIASFRRVGDDISDAGHIDRAATVHRSLTTTTLGFGVTPAVYRSDASVMCHGCQTVRSDIMCVDLSGGEYGDLHLCSACLHDLASLAAAARTSSTG